MSVHSLNEGDFVVATRQIDDILPHSVGLVEKISKDEITVFFIGKSKTKKTTHKNVSFVDVDKTGKPKIGNSYEMKICNICHLLKKNETEFDYNQNDVHGRRTTRPSCKECRSVIDDKNLDAAEKKKMDKVRPKPKSIFTCPICEKTTIVDVTVNLVRDHDHKTGKARSWICDSCNTGLGRFKDDIKYMKKAIKYLES